jgi:8-oxo-dGTP pyrophosphatase MutT (NUDIX family)
MTNDNISKINRYDAAGGVVVWDEKVLVLYRCLRNDYRLPKGHIEPFETAEAAALREIGEESGYVDLKVTADLGTKMVEFERNGTQIIRCEHYFLMHIDGEPNRIPHEEDRNPLWFGWEEAVSLLTFEAEKDWVRRARAIQFG